MSQLEVGDRVHVGQNQYSPVFMFTHRIPDIIHQHVSLHAGNNGIVEATLSLTKGHFLYVNGELKEAGKVKIGDELSLGDGRTSEVMSVECSAFKGLYNPQTAHGDLMVNGVRVSTYTTAVDMHVAHSMLAPLRAAFHVFGWSTSVLEGGSDKAAALLP